ncbi:MAG: hypothetical protein L7H05_03665 [Vulcanisaeta sp.]|nr:hypothetical protein [Vulcanisaeta sp.]
MVFGSKAEVYIDGEREVVDAVSGYFWNSCNSLYSRVNASPFIFYYYLYLSTPNYAPAAPLPSATVRSNFKLKGAYFLNEGYGSENSEYTIRFERRYLFVVYKVEISHENVLLTHHNRLAQFFVLSPVSALL